MSQLRRPRIDPIEFISDDLGKCSGIAIYALNYVGFYTKNDLKTNLDHLK